MNGNQLTKARRKLGLSLEQMATMLGYDGSQARSQVHHLESGRRTIRPAQRRLVQAYLDGYRPTDWPHNGDLDGLDPCKEPQPRRSSGNRSGV